MKKTDKSFFFLLTILSYIIVNHSLAFSAEKINIAMVLWRGVTKAEDGFQSRLKAEKKYKIIFTIFDAGQNKKRLINICDKLTKKNFHLIYTFGTTVTKTIKSKIKTTPIVFNIVARPVKADIIDSWEHSGSNITGTSNAVPMASAFKTVSKVLHISKLGFIYNLKEMNSIIQRDEIAKLQKTLGYKLIDAPITNVDTIPNAIEKVINKKVDAVLLPSDSLIKSYANMIVAPLNAQKIPTIVSIPAMVKDNHAFIGLGPDYYELGKLAAEKALLILAGKNPNEIPCSTLPRLHMTVNINTSKKIGINIPIQILRISTIIK